MNERLKEIRKTLSLSQESFAKKLGITGAGISKIESGDRNLTEQMILAICREFNVSEEWLRNGTGEMFHTMSQDEELAYIVGQALPTADDYVKDVFISLGKLSQELTPDDWKVIRKFVNALAGKDN